MRHREFSGRVLAFSNVELVAIYLQGTIWVILTYAIWEAKILHAKLPVHLHAFVGQGGFVNTIVGKN